MADLIRRYVVMGVSGCGKSTVGAAFARQIGAAFLEGDLLHPPANVAAMAAGRPLDDAMRAPWLDAIAGRLQRAQAPGLVVSCSALKRAYRVRLAAGGPVTFVHLVLSEAEARARVRARPGHFMPDSLVASQCAALEPLGADEPGWLVQATLSTAEILQHLAARTEGQI
ncbi:gluconokinase [Phaeovulum sp. W22_SRMD_FR3]|uniref:gluconokinase n=1 Tax=Phaeovulum sp. W22_SRMD_FR3 TaxID=3240274 RepID=UPI003F99B6CF